ncbi:hypothetical protein [Paraburkholderia dinghuensis]|uniref:Uncharacterized protein n=1 Tax=Paraburkholderia dinghuensis TaxID=2305225 RepID=A0A3N6MVE8_9BURK|nr:hypothetical protein [Paraburkholderia dinghuensis]RQH07944.1 hypothetical protein D1Y85_07520 [Paraburkholderia dinghuensis]
MAPPSLPETGRGAGHGKPHRNQISGNPQIRRPIHYNENAREENQNVVRNDDIEHILAAAQKHHGADTGSANRSVRTKCSRGMYCRAARTILDENLDDSYLSISGLNP